MRKDSGTVTRAQVICTAALVIVDVGLLAWSAYELGRTVEESASRKGPEVESEGDEDALDPAEDED